MIKKNEIGIFFLLLMFASTILNAQTKDVFLNLSKRIYFAKDIYTSKAMHADAFPISLKDLNEIDYDSTISSLQIISHSNLLDYLLNKDLLESKNNDFSFQLNPVFLWGTTAYKTNNSHGGYLGLTSDISYKDLHFNFTYAYLSTPDTGFNNNIIPGWGYAHSYTTGTFNNLIQGYINYHPGNVVGLELGYGKTFIGYGYRSMLLSDNASNYPYFKLSAKIWKLKYTMLVAQLQDIRFSDGHYANFTHKYMALHYLSWNVTKWLSGGFFESVIWQRKNGNIIRDFEPNYLNPVILYRPIEFSQGSADNMLLGANFKLTPFKNLILYQQTALDEFLLKELMDGNGWWGNKFGLQFGLRYFNAFGVKNLQIQVEANLARPYTYSYTKGRTSELGVANYAHFNQSLAHPLGANFYEYLSRISYFKKRFDVLLELAYSKKGLDKNGKNYGGNVYRDYQKRVKGYGNYILQGDLVNEINASVKISYLLNYNWDAHLFLGFEHQKRWFKNSSSSRQDNFLSVGIRTSIMNRYHDY